MTENEDVAGLEELAATVANRSPGVSAQQPSTRRRKVPSPRILDAGGFALRMMGVFLIIGGFWPFIWTVIEVIMLFGGESSDLKFQISNGTIAFRAQGWPAIIYGVIWSLSIWCCAIIAFALGHAMYVLRDLVGPRETPWSPDLRPSRTE